MQLELSQIRLDGGTQPRAMYHFGIGESYAEDMAAGAVFPPVIAFYDGTDYWLADGFHRVFAAEKIEWTSIEADVRQGTLEDAQWYSYSVNQAHGLRRSNEDKNRAVEAALKHPKAADMSDRDIADHCGVTHPFVAEVRKRITGNGFQSTGNGYRKGKDGVKRKSPTKKPKASKPAQSSQNGNEKAAPIPASTPTETDPDEEFHAKLQKFADGLQRLVSEYDFPPDAFQRIMDIFAEVIAAEVEQ